MGARVTVSHWWQVSRISGAKAKLLGIVRVSA